MTSRRRHGLGTGLAWLGVLQPRDGGAPISFSGLRLPIYPRDEQEATKHVILAMDQKILAPMTLAKVAADQDRPTTR
jgi:hypothetical protein